jgi:perosamine synthetase
LRAPVPFGQPSFGEREIEAVARVMRSGWVGMGPETAAFETELAAAIGVPHVVAVDSCTSALLLSLVVHGVGPGDEVICPSLTWCSTANVALHLGAKVVFCDVAPDTFCAGLPQISAALTPRTKAVLPVHFGGRAVDVAALRAGLPADVAIVEDAAHAFGARLPDGRLVGASGSATCFSFYANKVISTADGGAIALPDAQMAQRLSGLRVHGLSRQPWQRAGSPRDALAATPLVELGYKANYTDLQAAIGRVQLARQAEFSATRHAVAAAYMARLAGSGFGLQQGAGEADHAHHLFLVLLPPELKGRRGTIMTRMRELGIGVTVHYPPLHRMPLYGGEAAAPHLPVTDDLADRIMTLPIGPCMDTDDARWVADTLLALSA